MTSSSQTVTDPRKPEPAQDTGTTAVVTFYEFAGEPDAQSIGDLAEAHVKLGRKVLILTGSEDYSRHLSKRLWSYRADAFLPHGLPDDNARRQPVLIDWVPRRYLNKADTIITLSGSIPLEPHVRNIDYLFDGKTVTPTKSGRTRDGTDLLLARQRWFDLIINGYKPRYFSLLGRAPGSISGSWSRSA